MSNQSRDCRQHNEPCQCDDSLTKDPMFLERSLNNFPDDAFHNSLKSFLKDTEVPEKNRRVVLLAVRTVKAGGLVPEWIGEGTRSALQSPLIDRDVKYEIEKALADYGMGKKWVPGSQDSSRMFPSSL